MYINLTSDLISDQFSAVVAKLLPSPFIEALTNGGLGSGADDE